MSDQSVQLTRDNLSAVHCHCLDCGQQVTLLAVPWVPEIHRLQVTASCGCGVRLAYAPDFLRFKNDRLAIFAHELVIRTPAEADELIQRCENWAQDLMKVCAVLRTVTR